MHIYLATSNHHKLQEFGRLMIVNCLFHNIISPEVLGGMPEVDECGDTFEANAALKAEALLPRIPHGEWVLADDSGLAVDALDGAPGLYSARYAGPNASDADNVDKLLAAMRGFPASKRRARFVCVLYFRRAGDSAPAQVFRGECLGSILTQPEGEGGFGYDPVFVPDGESTSFAALPPQRKHQLSHRAIATRKWINFLAIR